MVKVVSSRSAGRALGVVVLALLVPAIVLGTFLYRELSGDIQFSQAELNGVKLISLAAPVLLASESDGSAETATTNLLTAGTAFADEIGMADDLARTVTSLRENLENAEGRNEQIISFIEAVGKNSKLVLDSEPEPLFLVIASALSLPDIIADSLEVEEGLESIVDGNFPDLNRVLAVNRTIGSLDEAVLRARESIEAAREASSGDPSYAEMEAGLEEIRAHLNDIAAGVESIAVAGAIGKTTMMDTIHEHVMHIKSDVEATWTATNAMIESRLLTRISQLQRKLLLTFAACSLSALLGFGLAINMMVSKLKQLDLVEASKLEAEAAAAEVRRISDDVIRLNVDLSGNLQKLKDAQDELVRNARLTQMGQLTATVAHELRNPLGAVRTSAFILERKLKDKNLGVEQQLFRIGNGITRCDNIITQLLDFARNKSPSLERKNFDLWLEEVLVEEAQKLPSSVQIRFDPGLDGQEVEFDAGRMSRVLINLLSNASEAMVGKGDDPSRFTTSEPIIRVSTRRTTRGVEFAVADNGPGMSAEMQAKCLEPLFTTKSFGTGLGLPATEKILREHGGGLEIKSTTGEGATLIAWFPATGQTEAAA